MLLWFYLCVAWKMNSIRVAGTYRDISAPYFENILFLNIANEEKPFWSPFFALKDVLGSFYDYFGSCSCFLHFFEKIKISFFPTAKLMIFEILKFSSLENHDFGCHNRIRTKKAMFLMNEGLENSIDLFFDSLRYLLIKFII